MQINNKLLFGTIIGCCFPLLSATVSEAVVADSNATVVTTQSGSQIKLDYGSAITQPTATITLTASQPEQLALVNINTATATQIADALKGVGISKAEAIVAYRENYGYFTSVDDLVAVKGIGNIILERVRYLIVLE